MSKFLASQQGMGYASHLYEIVKNEDVRNTDDVAGIWQKKLCAE